MLLLKDPCGAVDMASVGQGKQDHDDVELPGTGAGEPLWQSCAWSVEPIRGLCVPRTLRHARQPWGKQRSGILSWSHLCMCVRKEQS